MAKATFPGILRSLPEESTFLVFGDGSLTDSDTEELESFSPSIRVVSRQDREALVTDMLQEYPHCKSYREELPLAFKLLDVSLYCIANSIDQLVFTDSDIIYRCANANYFSRTGNTHLRTDAIKLSVRLSVLFLKYRWQVPYQFNSGYFTFDLKDFDLDFINHYLSLPDVRSTPWLSEQTCWALLFARAGQSFTPDPKQFACAEDFDTPRHDTMAIHLIGDLKKMAATWSNPDPSTVSHDIEPKFLPSRNVNFIDWGIKVARRVASR